MHIAHTGFRLYDVILFVLSELRKISNLNRSGNLKSKL